jgi:hypothetical protein
MCSLRLLFDLMIALSTIGIAAFTKYLRASWIDRMYIVTKVPSSPLTIATPVLVISTVQGGNPSILLYACL